MTTTRTHIIDANTSPVVDGFERALRERDQERANFNQARAELQRACEQIADMHAAAVGARGQAPYVGPVEDIANLKTAYDVLHDANTNLAIALTATATRHGFGLAALGSRSQLSILSSKAVENTPVPVVQPERCSVITLARTMRLLDAAYRVAECVDAEASSLGISICLYADGLAKVEECVRIWASSRHLTIDEGKDDPKWGRTIAVRTPGAAIRVHIEPEARR